MRRTKIIATLGPASNTPEVIRELIDAGADAFRLNFSHGRHADHARLIGLVREISRAAGRAIAIVADIQGPKIRLGEVYGTVTLKRGETFEITTREMIGNERRVSTPFEDLPNEVRKGHRILINDGLVELEVISVSGDLVRTTVVNGGAIGSKKGMNFPDTQLAIPSVTDKDREDIRFIAREDVDFVAASFVRRRQDVEDVRTLLEEAGGGAIGVIAKLEKPQAIEALDDILAAADGVMVARGDLGVEMLPEQVPIVQKRILRRAAEMGRFAITATQMLESMTSNARPTRAEASDVANAIFDGSDAVMLSGETASGLYPTAAVSMMSRIASMAEQNNALNALGRRNPLQRTEEEDDPSDALAGAAVYVAEHTRAAAVVVFSQTGFTARLVSKFRPAVPIIAFTPFERVARQMNLFWGVRSYLMAEAGEFHEEIVDRVRSLVSGTGLVEKGQRIVILMAAPKSQLPRTNLLRIDRAV